MKKCYSFLLLLTIWSITANAQPTTNAPTPPTRAAANVMSVYSGAYTDIAGTNFNPGWGQSTVVGEITISGNTIRSYTSMNYQGVEFAAPIDVSNMDSLHFDIWTSNCTAFEFFLINTTPTTVEQSVSVTPTLNGWKSVNVALSQFTNLALHNVLQLKLVATPFGSSNVYLDNIYFYKNSKTPTITGFSIPSKTLGSAPFTITPPTSNSTGAFTYTSSNPAVATVSGNTITVVGVGYTYIKASQAAAGAYGVGKKSTTFVVNSGLPTTPTTAAPTPTASPANVISLFSNAYTNRPVDTWSASWDVADSSTVKIAGNDTKKYTNLTYAGVEFISNKLDVTTMQFYHVDIWSPNATSFSVKLVDFGPNGVYGGGDDKEHEFVCTPPAFSTWVSYDIPMSGFVNLTTKAHLAQMLFITNPATTLYVDNVYFYKTVTSPVKLSSFTGTKSNNNVLLNWTTFTESNNKGFYVERSKNGVEWSTVTFVKGSGNSSSAKEYTTLDRNPFKGVNYYRLKQVDEDNKFTYSQTISVKFSEANSTGFSLYPNPAKNNLFISIDDLQNASATIKLINVQGQVMQSMIVNKTAGSTNVTLNVASLAPGMYILQLQDGTVLKNSKVVIH